MNTNANNNTTINVMERLGVMFAAVSAALLGGRSGLDVLGVLTVAFLTAMGGISAREVLLNRLPMPWLRDMSYMFCVIMATMTTMLYVRNMPPVPPIFVSVADSLGMILIAVTSARKAEQAMIPSLSIGLVACVAGTTGGIIRDLILQKVPLLVSQHAHATSVIASTSVYLLLQGRGVKQPVSLWVSLAVALILRFSALFGGFEMPFFNPPVAPFAPTSS